MIANRQYELAVIVTPEATEQEVEDLQTQITEIATRFEGRVDGVDSWGRRKLAYEIGRHREGIYVFDLMTGPPEMIKELDRRLKVVDNVLRHLVVRVDEDQRLIERARVRRQADADRRASRSRTAAGAGETSSSEGSAGGPGGGRQGAGEGRREEGSAS